MTLKINRLVLRLPPGYEARGERIARSVSRALADIPAGGGGAVSHLSTGRIDVGPDVSNSVLTDRIATAIAYRIKEPTGR